MFGSGGGVARHGCLAEFLSDGGAVCAGDGGAGQRAGAARFRQRVPIRAGQHLRGEQARHGVGGALAHAVQRRGARGAGHGAGRSDGGAGGASAVRAEILPVLLVGAVDSGGGGAGARGLVGGTEDIRAIGSAPPIAAGDISQAAMDGDRQGTEIVK